MSERFSEAREILIEPAAPSGPDGHFRLWMYRAISRMLANLRAIDDANALESFPFLAQYESALASIMPPALGPEDGDLWWQQQIAAYEQGERCQLPLRNLAEALSLDDEERLLLLAVGLIEEDVRFGSLFTALQPTSHIRRPSIGMLGWLLATPGALARDLWPASRTLIDHGLLSVANRDSPRAEWALQVPLPLWDALRGQPGSQAAVGVASHPASQFPDLADMVLPPALHQQVFRLPALLAQGQVGALALRGMRGSGRRTLAGSVARAIGRDLLVCESAAPDSAAWQLIGPLASIAGALPLLRCDPGPGVALDLPLLPGYRGPVALTLGAGGGICGLLVAQSLGLSLPMPDAAARRSFWVRTALPMPETTLDELSQRFLLNGGHIARAAPLARAYATLAGRTSVDLPDVQQAARTLNRQELETLATALEPIAGLDAVVAASSASDDLRALLARCRARELLCDTAGPAFASSLNRGVRAMFTGPSGTGKTLAARALAGALQMDLYRVDLAAVVNKYIGETERNLNMVLSRAEELDVLLLLDEGDALMAARTDVRSANDRYANLETNYLLQRLESYQGIVIITTNASSRIDQAFLRRLDATIEFAPPEASERAAIWRLHLPAQHALSAALLGEVAVRCALTGGQIRNAALHATLLAIGEGAPLGDAHLEAGLLREYRKAGAAYPLRGASAQAKQLGRLQQFAGDLG
ncbi:ATP-binding protein [Chloroflexia bacterium SDU3-3]|nr:ATP-binding protein [Chloroflexia bacterium SDU3-3]